jgi:hypothetical protein
VRLANAERKTETGGFSGSLQLAERAAHSNSYAGYWAVLGRDIAPCREITARDYRAHLKEA